jgi:hypothetical protein
MKLLTKKIENKLSALYSQNDKGKNALAYVKFFILDYNWTWYAMEYNPKKKLFFGLIDGFEKELGYFSLSQLETMKGPLGLKVERDIYFNPTSLKDLY